jgi:hypothetical protein
MGCVALPLVADRECLPLSPPSHKFSDKVWTRQGNQPGDMAVAPLRARPQAVGAREAPWYARQAGYPVAG